VPGADLAALAANTWTMYVRINKVVNIPFSENVVKSVAIGIGTNILSAVPALIFTKLLIKVLPVVGTVGGMIVNAGGFLAINYVSAFIYIKILTKLVSERRDLTDESLQTVAKEVREPHG
jgi:hypothetical protein